MATGGTGESTDRPARRVMRVFAQDSENVTILNPEALESHAKEVTGKAFCLSLGDVY